MRLPRSAKAMDRPRHIEDLADELLSEVLSFLLRTELRLHDTVHTNNPDPYSEANGYGERWELDRFRLVNKRFMRIGTPRKFSRFVLRFSRAGFQRLEHFLDIQLACYVRHFTYMVRPFYQGSGWSHILYGVGADHLPVSVLRSRLEDQRFLTDTNHDLFLLRRAMASFPSLQQVKLLRLQDGADEQLTDYIWTQPLEFTVGFDWEPACTRAITTLSAALLESPCNPIRFIGPQISPSSTANLLQIQTPSTTLSTLGTRLTTLDLTFHPTTMTSLTTIMQPLSSIFHAFFQSTTANLTSLHLGFPPKHPLTLPLDHIIPSTLRWKHLRSLSLQGWCLGAEEINALARRHRMQLRNIKLRSIYLREDDEDGGPGKKWQDVLLVLREEMGMLEDIDLRDIDYSRHFLRTGHRNGIVNGNGDGNGNGNGNANVYFQNHHLLPSPTAAGEDGIDNALSEQLRALTVDELRDDGLSVKPGQHRLWEAWVLCSVSKLSVR